MRDEELYSEEELKTKRKGKNKIGCVVLIIAVIIFFIILNNRDTPSSGKSVSKLSESQVETIDNLVQLGQLKVNYELNEAFIDIVLWNEMDYTLKEDFSAALAIYCGNKKGTQLYWVDIKDKRSGRDLAKYSQSWGFKVY